MKFLAALSLVSAATASMQIDTSDIAASSKMGGRLLSKARALNNNNNNQDITWISGYSLKFEKCATSNDYYGGYFGGEFKFSCVMRPLDSAACCSHDVHVTALLSLISQATASSSKTTTIATATTACTNSALYTSSSAPLPRAPPAKAAPTTSST